MTAVDGLPPLRKVIEEYGLNAKKSLGQNFLLDLNLTSRIARTAGDLTQSAVLEVGPGPGGLTRALLFNGARKVIAIERDERCRPALEEIAAHYPGRLEVVFGDALKSDIGALVKAALTSNSYPLTPPPLRSATLSPPGRGTLEAPAPDSSPQRGEGGPKGLPLAGELPIRIVANLPYNVGTELLIRWLTVPEWPPYYQSMTLMFQREVAQRIVATPGSDAYGRLSVLAGWRTNAKIAFDVSPQAFTPPPKVTSSVVHLVPRETPLPAGVAALGRVTEAAFGQRRKMLRQSLKSLGGERLLAATGIDGTRRAETLSVAEFVALANAL